MPAHASSSGIGMDAVLTQVKTGGIARRAPCIRHRAAGEA